MSGSGRTVQLFLQAAATAGELIGAEATADRWEQPSVLAGYFAAALGDHDPVESDRHRQIRDRARRTATGGLEVIRGLARGERHPDPIRAL